jgi:hypothetical protein
LGDGDDETAPAYGGDAEAGGGAGQNGGAPGGGTLPGGGTGGAATGTDPVKDADDDAWLAQFRADNAAAVAAFDRAALEKTEVELGTETAKRDLENARAAEHDDGAKVHGIIADEYEQKAAKDAQRNDEYENVAERARHHAAEDVAGARHARAEAASAEEAVKRLRTEEDEELDIVGGADSDYRALQEAAVAARRIAEDERRVQGGHQPGGQPPGGAPKP